MPAILFPKGMKSKKIENESIFMFYDTNTNDGKPNTAKASEILEFLTGSVSIGNKKFPTGDAVAALFQENAIQPNESLNGHLAQFNSTGQLESGGDFMEFEDSFLSNTSTSFK